MEYSRADTTQSPCLNFRLCLAQYSTTRFTMAPMVVPDPQQRFGGSPPLNTPSSYIGKLDRIASLRGYPAMIVGNNGTELTSHAILRWQKDRSVLWHYIEPGKPQ